MPLKTQQNPVYEPTRSFCRRCGCCHGGVLLRELRHDRGGPEVAGPPGGVYRRDSARKGRAARGLFPPGGEPVPGRKGIILGPDLREEEKKDVMAAWHHAQDEVFGKRVRT